MCGIYWSLKEDGGYVDWLINMKEGINWVNVLR